MHQSKRISEKIILLSFLIGFCFEARADFFIGASVASSEARVSQSLAEISYANQVVTDSYSLNKTHSSSIANGSLHAGYERLFLNERLLMDLGVGVYQTFQGYHFSGQVSETVLGETSAPLYNYQYTIKSSRLMLEGQIGWVSSQLTPYMSFGLGAVQNILSSYHEQSATSDGYPPLPGFQSHNNFNFALQGGVGLSKSFNFFNDSDVKHDRLSLGYQYAALGSNHFKARGADYPYTLSIGHLYTNDFYLTYSRFF